MPQGDDCLAWSLSGVRLLWGGQERAGACTVEVGMAPGELLHQTGLSVWPGEQRTDQGMHKLKTPGSLENGMVLLKMHLVGPCQTQANKVMGEQRSALFLSPAVSSAL